MLVSFSMEWARQSGIIVVARVSGFGDKVCVAQSGLSVTGEACEHREPLASHLHADVKSVCLLFAYGFGATQPRRLESPYQARQSPTSLHVLFDKLHRTFSSHHTSRRLPRQSMSGFEGIAAAIGVAELGLRAISRVYEFVRDMKDAPGTVIRLLEELLALKSCMSILASLDITGPTVPPALQDLQISATVNRCGETCSSLEESLRRWTHGGRKTLVSRLRVRINKSQIDSAILSISSTKETINLAVTIAS